MFAKLLKYDIRAAKRYVLPLLIALACLTVVGMVDGAVLVSSIETSVTDEAFFPDFVTTISIFSLLFIIFAIVALTAVIGILITVEYYKSTVTDEAYLTFTLPVRPSRILLSKTVNGVIWTVVFAVASIVAIVLILITMVIFAAPGSADTTSPVAPSDFGGIGAFIFVIISFIIYALSYIVNSILLYFMAVTLSSTITTKNRVLCAVGCIIGANFAYGIINNIIDTILSIAGLGVLDTALSSADGALVLVGVTALIRAIIMALFSVLFFFITNKLFTKKLNLA